MSPDWREQAACVGHPRHLFFDESSRPQARRICASCPVQQECLSWALRWDEQGVWGGTTELERKGMQVRPKPPTHGTPAGYAQHRRYPELFGWPCDACRAGHADAYAERKRAAGAAYRAAQRAAAVGRVQEMVR